MWIIFGYSFIYFYWVFGFLDDYYGNEDCLEFFKDERFFWNDEKCDY